MTTTAIGNTNPTMLDAAKRTDPNGGIAMIVEQLSKVTPELQDATALEGNLPTGHRITMRTALPSPTWRMANQGIATTKSLTDQVDEVCGQLAARSVVDPDVANLGGNEAAYRASEDISFVSSMGIEVGAGIFYHSTKATPEKFMGFAPRLNSTTGNYGGQVVSSGISHSGSDQSSAYWVCWGPKSCYLIYPKGSQAGLKQEDMGKQMVADADGNRFPAWETVFKWQVGLCVEDYRQVVRIPNIDTSAIAETGTLLVQDFIRGYHQLGNPNMGRTVLYVNRKIAAYLHFQALFGAVSSTLNFEKDIATGRPVLTFLGHPVRMTDSITNAEDTVS